MERLYSINNKNNKNIATSTKSTVIPSNIAATSTNISKINKKISYNEYKARDVKSNEINETNTEHLNADFLEINANNEAIIEFQEAVAQEQIDNQITSPNTRTYFIITNHLK